MSKWLMKSSDCNLLLFHHIYYFIPQNKFGMYFFFIPLSVCVVSFLIYFEIARSLCRWFHNLIENIRNEFVVFYVKITFSIKMFPSKLAHIIVVISSDSFSYYFFFQLLLLRRCDQNHIVIIKYFFLLGLSYSRNSSRIPMLFINLLMFE